MAIVNRKFDIPRAYLGSLVVMAGNIFGLERACGGKFKLSETQEIRYFYIVRKWVNSRTTKFWIPLHLRTLNIVSFAIKALNMTSRKYIIRMISSNNYNQTSLPRHVPERTSGLNIKLPNLTYYILLLLQSQYATGFSPYSWKKGKYYNAYCNIFFMETPWSKILPLRKNSSWISKKWQAVQRNKLMAEVLKHPPSVLPFYCTFELFISTTVGKSLDNGPPFGSECVPLWWARRVGRFLAVTLPKGSTRGSSSRDTWCALLRWCACV